MKRKIITALLILLLFSASGVALATYFITNTTTALSELVTLHQIEDLRQHLIISIQTVQSDLYTVKTMLGKNVDAIADNVSTLEASASECANCHHEPAIARDLHEIEALIIAYQDALSYYITASANKQRIAKLKLDASEIGNDILKKTEAMSFRAAKKLEVATTTALKKIRQARIILFSTIGFTLVFGVLIAIYLIRSVTGPIEQLVTATRAIAGGDLDHTVATGDKDEFGELADHFNAMSITLKKNYETLTKEVLERKQAQINLAAEKERLAVTLRSIGDGVITTDNDGLVVLINKTAELLTGWRQKEAAGRPVSEVFNIVSEKTGEPRENPVGKVLKTGSIVFLANHTALISKEGTRRSIADSGAPIRDRESRIVGVVLVFRDVTEANKMEEELLKVKKLESVGVLAGGIAHDFNNILVAVLGNINLALFDPELSAKTKKLLSEAEKASIRAKDLTQQLLTFSKGGDPVKEASSLEKVIKDSANFVLHGDKVACRYNIPEDLWLVDIDKGHISQVIQNLVLNGSHAMPEGGIITVSCENFASADKDTLPFARGERFVKITIQDSGIGMPAHVTEKIFDPYFSTKQTGSGLGLAITQSIISKHNGHISVESSPGVGSTFTIYLPASEETIIQKQEASGEGKPASSVKILVMDDDEMVRTVAKEMLEQLGHEVVVAADGGEALKLYQEAMESDKRFDLVIMDLTIPGGMGGQEAVQEILNIAPDAKVVVSSGYSNDPIMANYKDYGFCSAIAKPYQLQELSWSINQLMG